MREIIPSNTTILGGTGDDTISLTSDAENNLIQYKSGEGNDTITGFNEDDTLSISGSYSTQESGADLLVKVGEGTITLKDVRTTTETININGETIELEKNITLTDGDDSVNNSRDNVTINALGGNDIISNSSNEVTIDGGAGNDTISLGYLTYGNLIKYTEGDGNDLIQGFGEYNTLKIAGSSYSTKKSGEDIVVTVGEGKITLVGAASLVTPDIVDEKPAWTLNDTTAQYGTADNTLVTVDGVKSLNGISLNKKVVTIKKAALGTDKVTVSDGYTLKLGSDVTKPSASKAAWKLSGSTATYNQKTSAGYILDDNAITYNKQSTKALVTVKGVKSISGLSVSGDTVTVKKASLGTSNVTVSDGYTLKLGSDVTKPSASKAAWKLSGSTATYNQTTSAGYTLDDDGKSVSYSKTTTKALAAVKGAKSVKGLSVSGEKITLKNSALKNKVTVSGAYEFDFASDYKQATISGSANGDTLTAHGLKVSINGGNGNDTIKIFGSANTVTGGAGNDSLVGDAGNDKLYGGTGDDILIGGAGNDSLWGDAGADNFIYSSGDGKDVIFGFDNNDTLTLDGLELTSGTYNKTKGELTLKVDSGSITLKDFSATTFNVNGSNYKISGSKLVKK